MLVIGVQLGREIIVGDDMVIMVKQIDRVNEEVKLGFDSAQEVWRVNNAETTVKAAKIRARAKLGMGKKLGDMERKPVYVASYVQDDKPQVKAALTASKASFPGSTLSTLTDETKLSLASHQFLVVRCANDSDARQMRFFAKQIAGWPVLDEVEADDSTLYLLFVKTTAEKEGGDVAYFDTTAL